MGVVRLLGILRLDFYHLFKGPRAQELLPSIIAAAALVLQPLGVSAPCTVLGDETTSALGSTYLETHAKRAYGAGPEAEMLVLQSSAARQRAL